MANWSILKSAIADAIKTNGSQEITGQVLQNILKSIVSSVGENATFAGVALPSTNPGTPDGPVFYFANTSGTYSNFGGLAITDKNAFLLWKDNKWTKVELSSASSTQSGGGTTELSQIIDKSIEIFILSVSCERPGEDTLSSDQGVQYSFDSQHVTEKYRIVFPEKYYSIIKSSSTATINPKYKLLFLRQMTNRVICVNTDWFGNNLKYDQGVGGHAFKKQVRGRHWVPFLRNRGEQGSWRNMEGSFVANALMLDFDASEIFKIKYNTVSLDFTKAFNLFVNKLTSDYIVTFVNSVGDADGKGGYIYTDVRKNRTKHPTRTKKAYFTSASRGVDSEQQYATVTDYMHCGVALYDTSTYKIVSNIFPFDVQIKFRYDIVHKIQQLIIRLIGRRALAHRPIGTGL